MIFGHCESQWGKFRGKRRAESIHQHPLISRLPVGTGVTCQWHPLGQCPVPTGEAQHAREPISGWPGTAGALPAPAAGAATAKSLWGLIPSPSSPQRRDFPEEHQAGTRRAVPPRDLLCHLSPSAQPRGTAPRSVPAGTALMQTAKHDQYHSMHVPVPSWAPHSAELRATGSPGTRHQLSPVPSTGTVGHTNTPSWGDTAATGRGQRLQMMRDKTQTIPARTTHFMLRRAHVPVL